MEKDKSEFFSNPTSETPSSKVREVKPSPKPTKVANPFVKIYANLSKEIPKEHHIPMVRDDVTLTGYPGQIVIDRLNEYVGIENWYTQEKILHQELIGGAWAVAIRIKLVLLISGHERVVIKHGYGAQYARRIEDAFGGAFTNALKRAARQLGIGKELYYIKDEEDMPSEARKDEAKQEAPVIPEEAVAIEEKISKAENLEQLESLSGKVDSIKGLAVKKVLTKKFNDKKISLSK